MMKGAKKRRSVRTRIKEERDVGLEKRLPRAQIQTLSNQPHHTNCTFLIVTNTLNEEERSRREMERGRHFGLRRYLAKALFPFPSLSLSTPTTLQTSLPGVCFSCKCLCDVRGSSFCSLRLFSPFAHFIYFVILRHCLFHFLVIIPSLSPFLLILIDSEVETTNIPQNVCLFSSFQSHPKHFGGKHEGRKRDRLTGGGKEEKLDIIFGEPRTSWRGSNESLNDESLFLRNFESCFCFLSLSIPLSFLSWL